jgi:carbonic anhydrase
MMKTRKYIQFTALLGSLVLLFVSLPLMAGEGAPHWTYEGEEGPEHWGELGEEYRMCAEGMNQSPIDLVAVVNADLPELVFDYYSTPVDQINNGHTIQQNVMAGSFLRIPARGMSFELKQFHFHSPSEHKINGQSFAMELHFVHANEEGALGVVGVLIKEGKEHPVLKQLWSFMPENAGDTSQQPIGIEDTNLLPPTREYFTYGGSLTTPPCSEGVKWIILKTPIEASAEQIAIFKSRVGQATNRPVQPHNARTILD